MSKKSLGCVIAVVVVAVVVLSGFILSIVGMIFGAKKGSFNSARVNERIIEKAPDDATFSAEKIVVIDIVKVIANQRDEDFWGVGENMMRKTIKLLKRAKKDEDVKAVILRVNSPGGEVTASDFIYQKVKELEAEKPVISYFESVAASGAYYISAPSTHIISSPTCITGSVGVIIQSIAIPKLLEKINVESLVFKSGKAKDILNPMREMKSEEKKIVQDLVDDMFERFVKIVADGRKLSVKKVKKLVGDGRIIAGGEAKKIGLVDQIGYFDDAIAKARELGKAPNAKVISYRQSRNFFEKLASSKSFISGSPKNVQLDLLSPILKNNAFKTQAGFYYYLAPGFAR